MIGEKRWVFFVTSYIQYIRPFRVEAWYAGLVTLYFIMHMLLTRMIPKDPL